ncbi:MAG: glucose 1-dehydrogenase [Porticoccaceae bacterium]|jgi:3alpha(or 20beta)-hydroxysteroid dehydrogenase
MRLEGKVALISGAAKGMGASHARAIISEGGKVILGDISDEHTNSLAAELGDDNALAVHLDVTSASDWEQAVKTGVERFGKINVLVNNAGILHGAPLENYEDKDWYRLMDVNLNGVFKGIRAIIPAMKACGGGSIINISSTAGMKGFAGASAYVTSKFGIRGLTKAAAVELAMDGIRVNSVHPGNIDTDMIAGMYKKLPHVPMERMGKAEEISHLVVFLASDESSFSTGAEFLADGGEIAGMANLFAEH